VQALAIVLLVWQVKSLPNVAVCASGERPAGTACVDPGQFYKFGVWMAQQDGLGPEQIALIEPAKLEREAGKLVGQRQDELFLSLNANPVELAALITAFAATLFVIIFTGRAAAYFAVVAFLFVIFTYLGVSYLLPGLHSYA
ncbi:MAG: hypothetical protein ABR557_14915, partial [Pyrinomonadaceae bacterium]